MTIIATEVNTIRQIVKKVLHKVSYKIVTGDLTKVSGIIRPGGLAEQGGS